MQVLKANFAVQKQDSTYLNFIKNKIILGTWDDHDFGVNDGGQEYLFKKRKSKLLI
jgi:alkaline phosphatase D